MAVAIALLIAIPQSAEASRSFSVKNNTDKIPTLAILDTGLDTSLPIFSGKSVQGSARILYCKNRKICS
jgi:hypothetical protein